jgi:hypothetical protein
MLSEFAFSIGSSYTGIIPGNHMNCSTTDFNNGNCIEGVRSCKFIGINNCGLTLLKCQLVVFEGGASPRLGLLQSTLCATKLNGFPLK